MVELFVTLKNKDDMNSEIRKLEPQSVWNNFADLNKVPRPSGKEERVRKFMRDFGKSLNLETLEDKKGNVVIKKPATSGMENRKTVVLQSHLDMVHQKNKGTDFDFSSEGIKMEVDDDWVRAKGTTLGADNGLGVAAIMAVLESKEMEHPPLEALFTVDEEAGMTGAKALDDTILDGAILLNLDTEEDDEIGVGCAGGVDITAVQDYKEESNDGQKGFSLKVKGLKGGHSGMEIDQGLGNANKLMNRLLYVAAQESAVKIISINGGGLRNAIPRESEAKVVVPTEDALKFKEVINKEGAVIKTEYTATEEALSIAVEETELQAKSMSCETTKKLLKTIYALHNGVYRMSRVMEGLVQTSNNIARVEVKDGKMEIRCLTRSSVDTSKRDLANGLTCAFELGGFKVKESGHYPGWQPNFDSEILKTLTEVYQKLHNEKPRVAAGHGGLECGILLGHYPNIDMVSFGPTIRGAHSPDERAKISSTQKFWQFLGEVLKTIPKKD